MILNLQPDLASLWTNIRKSYKSLINGILKSSDYKLVFVDKNDPDYSINEKYRLLHVKAAGRETRPKSTFDLQFELVKQGKALIAGLMYKNNFVAFNYFLFHQNTVVYMSASDDPDYAAQKIPFYHATLWASIQHLKSQGLEYMQLSSPASSQLVEGFIDYSDSKQLDISFFKKGMGAKQVPFNRGIKYYKKELFLADLEKFKSAVIENHFNRQF